MAPTAPWIAELDALLAPFGGYTTFAPADIEVLRTLMTELHVPAHQPLYDRFTPPRHDYLILQGGVKCVTQHPDGERILFFAFEGEAIGYPDLNTPWDVLPKTEQFETLEPCRLLRFDHEAFARAARTHPALLVLENLTLKEYINFLQRRLHAQLSTTAAARYEQLLRYEPHLPQRVPQHLLANYLGMSPETLSRIRAQRAGT